MGRLVAERLCRSRAIAAFAALAVALAPVLAYWPTMALPLIYDDLLHIRIVKGLDMASVWLPTEAFGFYRPMTFVPLLVIGDLFDGYPAALLHGINVGQHALNALLVAWLSWRLWGRRSWALAAGLLLALFPFSYQAVAVYGHNVHPATAGLILLGLHVYVTAVRRPDRAALWWALCSLILLLALLGHESALLFGFLAAVVHWQLDGRLPDLRSGRHFLSAQRRPWLVFTGAGLVYFVVYQFLPLSRAPQADFGGGTLGYKLLYVLQAVGYPVSWIGSRSPLATAVAPVLFGLGVTLALTVWSGRREANRLPLLLGWSWWAMASVVVAAPLPANYLLHGPRLLYLSSAGLALLWPVLLEPIYRVRRAGPLLWAAALSLVLVANWLFVRDRLDAYRRLTAPITLVEQVMAERPPGEGVLLVNLPQWLAPAEGAYPVGVELVAQLGDYLFVEELIGENLGHDRPVQAIRVPDLLSDQAYTYRVHEQGAEGFVGAGWAPGGSHVFVTRYEADGPEAAYVGRLMPGADDRAIATLGPYELTSAEARQCGGQVWLETTWRPATGDGPSRPTPTTSLFSQLLAADGRFVSQADGPPLSLRPDLLQLPPGWQATDRRVLPDESDAGDTLLLGTYDFASGERYPALDGAGRPLGDDALRLEVIECRD
jgi:hypothetical protein